MSDNANGLGKDLFSLDEPYGFPAANIRFIEDIPATLQAWMAHLAREMLRLGVFFQAATVMAQVPGAGKYEFLLYDDDERSVPDLEYDPADRMADLDRDTVYTILAECLKRLEAEHLLEKIPVTARRLDRLSAEWEEFIDIQENFEHAYQNVIAECLNTLVIIPGMEEINRQGKTTWWQQCWANETQKE